MNPDVNLAHYIEINVIAIVMAIVLFIQERRLSSKNETSTIITNLLTIFIIIFSLSDIFAYAFRGRNHFLVEFSNIVYFIMMALGSYTWFMFICVKMGYAKNIQRTLLATCGPIFILGVAICLNHFHHFFFLIDETNKYQRGTGIALTWVVEWGYMVAALVLNIIAVVKEQRGQKKSEYFGYIFFIVPLVIAAVIQMLFYGTTTTQIGFVLALFMAYVNRQAHESQKDGLTGLNNKNAFLTFRDSFLKQNKGSNLTIFILDADNFKSINDRYGHLQGDQALKDIASVLEAAVKEITSKRLALYRYAGDEFVIVGTNIEEHEPSALKASIQSAMEEANRANHRKGAKYMLSVSVGYARSESVDGLSEFDLLFKEADANMYQQKNAKHHVR